MGNKQFLETFKATGTVKFPVENNEALSILTESVKGVFGKSDALNNIHKSYSVEQINEFRMQAFREINKIKGWEGLYFSLAEKLFMELVGPDILIQNKLNLSIQMPDDFSSKLGMHTDTLSGQSEFEVVLWVPLTDVYETNSMYLFDQKTTKQIYAKMPHFEKKGMDALFEEFKDRATFIELKQGEALIFSPSLFHGNVVNRTDKTRVSINCRFKSLFAPEFEEFPTERKAGPFYKLFQISPVTEFALNHDDSFLVFQDD